MPASLKSETVITLSGMSVNSMTVFPLIVAHAASVVAVSLKNAGLAVSGGAQVS